jgi:hypothetical protein
MNVFCEKVLSRLLLAFNYEAAFVKLFSLNSFFGEYLMSIMVDLSPSTIKL